MSWPLPTRRSKRAGIDCCWRISPAFLLSYNGIPSKLIAVPAKYRRRKIRITFFHIEINWWKMVIQYQGAHSPHQHQRHTASIATDRRFVEFCPLQNKCVRRTRSNHRDTKMLKDKYTNEKSIYIRSVNIECAGGPTGTVRSKLSSPFCFFFSFQFEIEWKMRYDSSNAANESCFPIIFIDLSYFIVSLLRKYAIDKNRLIPRLGAQMIHSTNLFSLFGFGFGFVWLENRKTVRFSNFFSIRVELYARKMNIEYVWV